MDKERYQFLTMVYEAVKFYYEILIEDPTGELLGILDEEYLEAIREEYNKILQGFKISIEHMELEDK